MLVHEGVRSFQKTMTKYINGDDVVIIEDAKTHIEKGVFMPYKLYILFQEQAREKLEKESELIINWMCSVDFKRVISETPLTVLTQNELAELKPKLDFFMGYFD